MRPAPGRALRGWRRAPDWRTVVAMVEYGEGVAKGAGGAGGSSGGGSVDLGAGLAQSIGNAYGSLDASIHQVLPAAIPSWLVIGLALLLVAYLVLRR